MFWSTLAPWALLLPSLALAKPIRRDTQAVPSFVLQYAPLSYLHSQEKYWPADIADHLTHVTPQQDNKNVADSVDFSSIGSLGSDVYLTSKDDVGSHPAWLGGIPTDSTGFTDAPATIIVANKADGVTDAFYFYFYSYDHATYLDLQFGDHVGDWEHSAVRFVNGEPTLVYLSAHSGGSAYNFSAVEKQDGRPVTYIANGTHANYATTGAHQHDLPLLDDQTDKGHLWDVTKNFRGFTYDVSSQSFAIASGGAAGGSKEAGEGVGWLNFPGHWGDKQYPILTKDGQYCITSSECKYVDGPTGPKAKNLGRTAICQNESKCDIKSSL